VLHADANAFYGDADATPDSELYSFPDDNVDGESDAFADGNADVRTLAAPVGISL
jgi:hypothetical protein